MKSNIISQVLILSIIMGIGIICGKKEILNEEVNKKLSELLVKITLPCLIISSFNYNFTGDMIKNARMFFVYSVIIHIGLILISGLFFIKHNERARKVLKFSTIFSNSAFMGYPVIEALYGKVGVFYASIFGIPYNILMLSVGIMIYTGEKDIKNLKGILKHPGIIATVLGMFILIFHISIPMPIKTSLQSVGSMTTPLSMIIVGAMLADINIKEIFSGIEAYYGAFVRLIIIPVLVYILMIVLKADKLLLEICVILEAMPTAVLATVLAEEYNADVVLAAKCVFITTILSIITIPLIVAFIS
ncbi:AEC family transporter [Clostridium sporogenes]|uniref:AEC family transporter n=1 Tax=Clostridium sporogenes TaxID=1509 RepID=A0AAE4FNM4_CLOSG|nr:AEC family transporter [Clostridium sporogenes]MDS1004400.1 AEC family transporter [Clostridium sporogenes]NFN87357.1 AEC family transporter [Clostridium sporogenes]NFS25125.1 AEC family transporter [Clostridium sporogenes]